ncbi:MAG TPA: Uma2 family endonuclease [Pirellulales bacterium]|nr:Uma2 family endonuclease [Pirellulales bacterium]
MATTPAISPSRRDDAEVFYPTGDSRPVGETPIHRDNLLIGVKVLDRHFAADPMIYVSGNMFVYYEKGNRRKHVSPDVFVAVGVPKDKPRDAYFVWEEEHVPDVVIELTSKSTQGEDIDDKMSIYQDEMPVREYFLFDPKDEYLDPPLQGYRMSEGKLVPIEMANGRLPSEVLGLDLERDGEWLRYYDPVAGRWLPTPDEREAALEAALAAERDRAEAERERLATELKESGEELERLRRELEAWRRRYGGPPAS